MPSVFPYTAAMATAGASGNRATPPPRLRRDAQRNRDAILTAAGQVFCDQGLEAPLEEIARRAGVGIGTLYRRFPSRAELLDAVLTDTLQAHIEVAEQALAMADPWEGFCSYLEETCRLQANDRGLNDALGMRFPRTPALEAARRRLYDLGGRLIARAQQAGRLRADLTHEDLVFVTWANARVLQGVRAAGAPDAWRRHLGFLLDGFRADRAHPLPEPPLAPRQVYRAMLVLGRRSAGTTDQPQRPRD
jgi:AcrR family transcriptional regulator